MKFKTLEEFLRSVPENHRQYYVNTSRGYYDREKYRRTAAADLKRTSQTEDPDPPQC